MRSMIRILAFAVGCGVVVASAGPAVQDRARHAPPPRGSASPAPQSQPAAIHLLSFRAAAVDGVDVLVLRGDRMAIEHKEWQPIAGLETKVHATPPRTGDWRVAVRNHTGRPGVSVIRQPRADNEFETRVLIDDGPAAGAAPLSFDLYAVPARRAPRPVNVLVVTLDSLRPDRLGCYGHTRPTSPNLDGFARQCVRFTNAFSTTSFTPPAHASLLTSQYVGDHGVLTWNAMANEKLTLPEVLASYDYDTGASVCLGLLSEQNLGQGIEWGREGTRDAREIVSDALEFIRRPRDRPFFLWLHFYDIHRPYGRSPNWTRLFGRSDRAALGDGEDHYNLTPRDVAARSLGEADLQYIVDRYDAGIAYTDAQLAPLLAELSTPQRAADTLIIITADHGENLLDHRQRLFTHDPFLYASVTRIPLLIRIPGGRGAGRTCDALVSLIDIAPTVLDLTGVPRPPTFVGLSLAALPDGPTLKRSEIFMECWGWEQRKAVRTLQSSVILDMKTSKVDAFDVSVDPNEQRALSGALPDATKRLSDRLAAFATRKHITDESPLSERARERLRALGYVND